MRKNIIVSLGVLIAVVGGLVVFNINNETGTPDTAREAGSGQVDDQIDDQSLVTSQSVPSAPAKPEIEGVDVLAERLKARLENEPNDMAGWVLLAKSYHFLGQWEEAGVAFDKAKALGYTGEAPALDQGQDKGGSNERIAIVSGKNNWLTNYINEKIIDENVKKSATVEGTAGLTVNVSVDPVLIADLAPETMVFIFARDENQPGPPLAVVKKQLSDLPLKVHLDDSSAMMADRALSSVTSVILGARISVSGNPVKSAGDIEVLSDSVNVDSPEVIPLFIAAADPVVSGGVQP